MFFSVTNCSSSFFGILFSDIIFIGNPNRNGTKNSEVNESSGRAINDNQRFPFPLKDISSSTFNKPSNHRYNTQPRIVYASSHVSRKKIHLSITNGSSQVTQ